MIQSLFMVNKGGDVFMEKHWKSVVNKSICDYFFEAQVTRRVVDVVKLNCVSVCYCVD